MKKIQNSDAEIYIRFLQQQPFIYAQLEFFCDLSQVLYTSGDWLLLFGTCILPGISNLPLFQFRSIVYLVMFCTEGCSLALKFYDLRNGNRIAELIHVINIRFIYILYSTFFRLEVVNNKKPSHICAYVKDHAGIEYAEKLPKPNHLCRQHC